MANTTNRTVAVLIAITAWLSAGSAWGAVVAVSVTPPARNIALDRPTAISLTWRVSRLNIVVGMSGPGATVSSTRGEFVVGSPSTGLVLRTVPVTLSQTKPVPPPVPITVTEFTFQETLLVPLDVARRAHALGFVNVFYRRTFSDGAGAAMASVDLRITSSAVTPFGVSRLALYFDDRAPVRVVGRNEILHIFADISTTGTGLLRAVWEIAEPPDTAGEPVFRSLRTVQQYLAAGESRTLTGPELRTSSTGVYFVRLRITEPQPAFQPPVIRYFVGEGVPGGGRPPAPLTLVSPPPSALVLPELRFSWQAIRGARAYQLEVFHSTRDSARELPTLGGAPDKPGSDDVAQALAKPAVTGMLVPGAQTQTVLSGMARRRLESGRTYLWRVRAIGEDGTVIGESPMREIHAP